MERQLQLGTQHFCYCFKAVDKRRSESRKELQNLISESILVLLMRLSLLRETPPPPPPPPRGIRRDLTFIKANCPWLGVNNWSIVYTTWSDKRSNACPTTVKCVASYDIHASNPHLIPTSPQGRGVSRNNDRCISA